MVYNLGVFLDLQLLLEEQVVAVTRRAFAHLKPVAPIPGSLTVIHSLVTFYLDYLSAFYMELPLEVSIGAEWECTRSKGCWMFNMYNTTVL